MKKPRYPGYFTDVPGFRLGHSQDLEKGTGVSVILPPAKTVGGVDVRGAAPGSRETDLLRPENTVGEVHAVVLSGGSAFGLDSCSGVMSYLRDRGTGFATEFGPVPIVCGAVLYDLGVADPLAYPASSAGYQAAEAAAEADRSMGNVGAGTGASVGKILGMSRAMKSGLGQASMCRGDLWVSCVVAVNAVGDVFDLDRGYEAVAGPLDEEGKRLSTVKLILGGDQKMSTAENTTIAALATNAKLDKAACLKLAQMAHDGYARAIEPVHTTADGDTIFTLASGAIETDLNVLGTMAVEVVRRAIVNACLMAEDSYGLRAFQE